MLPVTFGRWFGLRTEAAARRDRKLGTASSTRLLLHTPCHLDSEGTGQVFGGVRRGPPRAPFPGRVFAGRRLSVQVGARPWECGLPQTRSRPRASHGEAGLLGRRGRFGRAPGVCFVSGRRLPLRLRTSEPRRVLRESRAEPGIRRHEAGTARARHDRSVILPPVPASLERAAGWSWRLLVCAAVALAVLALLWYLRVIVLPIMIALTIAPALAPVAERLRQPSPRAPGRGARPPDRPRGCGRADRDRDRLGHRAVRGARRPRSLKPSTKSPTRLEGEPFNLSLDLDGGRAVIALRFLARGVRLRRVGHPGGRGARHRAGAGGRSPLLRPSRRRGVLELDPEALRARDAAGGRSCRAPRLGRCSAASFAGPPSSRQSTPR